MKYGKVKRILAAGCAVLMTASLMAGCGKKAETNSNGEEIVELTWSQVGDNQKMQVVINTGDAWDMCFTCSWTNDYLQNAQKGAFLELDDLLKEEGSEMYDLIDSRFWEAAKVGGKIYGVPSEKEIGNMPMWVFTKELVDKYSIPYEDLHSLEDLEPWLQMIKEKKPDVVLSSDKEVIVSCRAA